MKKYEVIDYEVRADPVAEPVASSTEKFQPHNQPASCLENSVTSSSSFSHSPGDGTVFGSD
jgi:hypothetical protein